MKHVNILAAARRSQLSMFLIKCFETLHPGQPPLQIAWYLQAICHSLENVAAVDRKRLVITVPPRHLKSITASVAFVAWLLGRNPGLKIMVASYSEDLAREHAGQCRTIMESDWYRALFPATQIRSRGLDLGTTANGGRKAVSVGGSITGFGADLIIIDDCMKADEVRSQTKRDEIKSWFENTLVSRLNDKGTGSICSIQQRLHEDDLPAYLLEKGYEHLNLPAIAEKHERIPLAHGRWHERSPGDVLNPDREDTDLLAELRRELGPVVFSAQYQQEPVTPEGNLLRLEWFGAYDELPQREELLKVIQSWDTAETAAPTSDYSVCTTWGFTRARKWLLLDVFRDRLDYPDLKRAVILQERKWQADRVLIEDANSGKSLHAELRRLGPFTPFLCPAREHKETRLIATLAEVESGLFLLPREAPWLDAFRSELRAFPSGKNDDQVDSFSQFVRYQMLNWRWVLTRYDKSGRPQRVIRLRKRPY